MKKKFWISSSITSASDYSFICEYNKNIFPFWSMIEGRGYGEDIVTCHTFHDSQAIGSYQSSAQHTFDYTLVCIDPVNFLRYNLPWVVCARNLFVIRLVATWQRKSHQLPVIPFHFDTVLCGLWKCPLFPVGWTWWIIISLNHYK